MRLLEKICTKSITENHQNNKSLLPIEERFHSTKCFYYPNAKKLNNNNSLEVEAAAVNQPFLLRGKTALNNLKYREKLSFCCRKSESASITSKFDDKIPVIIERFRNEKRLPELDRCQFAVPKFATVGQLQHVIKQRLGDFQRMAVYVVVANRELPSLTTRLSDLYTKYRDDDGFLYITFSSEDAFG
uniref:Autophagy-related protein n=1 Tax=Panagrolaimus sp. ES5 TaxID=591445 RepID=A0AC34F0G3_9BILA